MKFLSLEEAAIFHGHLGPFLTIGYLAGEFAVKELKPETEFDLFALIFVPKRRPYTCIVDGIQCSTKCTLGKGNVEVINSKEFKIVLENKRTKRRLLLKIKEEILDKIKEFGEDMEGAVNWLRRRNLQDLFWIEQQFI